MCYFVAPYNSRSFLKYCTFHPPQFTALTDIILCPFLFLPLFYYSLHLPISGLCYPCMHTRLWLMLTIRRPWFWESRLNMTVPLTLASRRQQPKSSSWFLNCLIIVSPHLPRRAIPYTASYRGLFCCAPNWRQSSTATLYSREYTINIIFQLKHCNESFV